MFCHANEKKKTAGGLGRGEKEGTAPFSVTDPFRISCCTVIGINSNWSVDNAPLSDIFDELITFCQIVL